MAAATDDDDESLGFDALTEDALRAAGSLKWTRYGSAIGAFVAEMDFGTAPVVRRALHEAVDAGTVRLPHHPGRGRDGPRLRPVAAAPVRLDGAGRVDHARSPTSSPGCRPRSSTSRPRDGAVVLPTPAYMPFLAVPGALGRELIEVPMVERDGRATYDLGGIARAFDDGGRLFVHVNPHNPLGRVFDAAEQLALADVVDAAGARVFADEIHAPAGPSRRRPPPVRVAVTAHRRAHGDRDVGVQGVEPAGPQGGAAAPAERRRRCPLGRGGTLFGHGASTLGVLANTVAYDEGGPWLDGVLTYLDGNRRLLAELLADRLPQVRYTLPEGTYLAWLDCRALGLPGSAGDFFLERAGVALVDGPECGSPGAGHVRLNFALRATVLRTVVDRMAAAVAAR